MHVIVIGGGIIGVTTAYFLRQSGCNVTLVERSGGVAQETSFANAGIIAPGYGSPWAAPGMAGKVLRAIFHAESPIMFQPTLDLAQWKWLRQWLAQCNLERYKTNRSRMQRVALYSRTVLRELRERLQLYYEQSSGYLQLFRTEREYELSALVRQLLSENGIPHSVLDEASTRAFEPGISSAMQFKGALHLPEEESGNCALFARVLRKHAESDGVQFRFDHLVHALSCAQDRVRVNTDKGILDADVAVICAGVGSAALARPLGISIPMWPVKGFSATAKIAAGEHAPRTALVDEAYKVAITRMGNRIRIAGIAQFGDHRLALHNRACNTLIKVARDWFPHASHYADAIFWCGARPMLPDGPPLLGATREPRVFLNLGHGNAGWAMSCGSAQILADLVIGREPAISLDGLTLARYT